MSFETYNTGFFLLTCGFLSLTVPFGWSGQHHQQRGSKSDEFSCPEEFGYYPHPNDCTQYYVCVFGGPILESCTGGLMYSHELQTCDWPRNVGCTSNSAASSGISTNSVSPLSSSGSPLPENPSAVPRVRQHTTPSWRQDVAHQQRLQREREQREEEEEIQDKNLYEEEDLGPAEEIETDRQQRVYRGQPPTLGQVARDRDGIVRHANALQNSPSPEKVKPIGIVSFGTHHQNLRPAQQQSESQYLIEQPQRPVSSPSPLISTSSSSNSVGKNIFNASHIEPYYSVYDEDADIYRDFDYGPYENQKNSNKHRNGGSGSYQVIQPEQTTKFRPSSPSPTPTPFVRTQPSPSIATFTSAPHAFNAQKEEDGEIQQSEKTSSFRGRNRGSVTYTTAVNEFDNPPAAPSGKVRPTLKPSTSIVSKVTEIDIYKYPPKRPDPIYPTPQVDKTAAKCRKDICFLPDCSCGGREIPGDLSVEETPQLVLLTFDDSVNELNRGLYSDLFDKGRTNPNGCPISATFYVSHEWTDYSMVQNLYAGGHEIASHSVSHSFGEQFSQRKWTKEMVGQREILSAYGGVRQEDIRGMRAPFLAVGGNKMFKMLYDSNFTYDSSMPIYENRPPSWPYTLDYKIFHDCMIPPCPTRSYPGVWEVPMVMWQDLNGGRCSMGDACSNPPEADGVYKMLLKNFERHFTTNRAPFGLFYHSSWFTQPHHKEGFLTFLDTIVNMPEVWLVTNWQAIQWARDPTPISKLNNFAPFSCNYPERPKKCNNAKVCNLWHKSGVRYLKTCQPCPDVFPWTGKTGVRNSRVDNDDAITE